MKLNQRDQSLSMNLMLPVKKVVHCDLKSVKNLMQLEDKALVFLCHSNYTYFVKLYKKPSVGLIYDSFIDTSKYHSILLNPLWEA